MKKTLKNWKESIFKENSVNQPSRQFQTGALRNSEEGKLDYEGFNSPLVMERFAEYLHKHRKLGDGSMRASDNWQLGIPKDVYMKSAFRHFMDVWKQHRGYKGQEELEESLCAVIFNMNGYLFELLKQKGDSKW